MTSDFALPARPKFVWWAGSCWRGGVGAGNPILKLVSKGMTYVCIRGARLHAFFWVSKTCSAVPPRISGKIARTCIRFHCRLAPKLGGSCGVLNNGKPRCELLRRLPWGPARGVNRPSTGSVHSLLPPAVDLGVSMRRAWWRRSSAVVHYVVCQLFRPVDRWANRTHPDSSSLKSRTRAVATPTTVCASASRAAANLLASAGQIWAAQNSVGDRECATLLSLLNTTSAYGQLFRFVSHLGSRVPPLIPQRVSCLTFRSCALGRRGAARVRSPRVHRGVHVSIAGNPARRPRGCRFAFEKAIDLDRQNGPANVENRVGACCDHAKNPPASNQTSNLGRR